MRGRQIEENLKGGLGIQTLQLISPVVLLIKFSEKRNSNAFADLGRTNTNGDKGDGSYDPQESPTAYKSIFGAGNAVLRVRNEYFLKNNHLESMRWRLKPWFDPATAT